MVAVNFIILKKNHSKKKISEVKGVTQSNITNANAIKNIKLKRQILPSSDALFNLITQGDTTALSQGITRIESQKPEDRILANELITKCLGKSMVSSSIRVGITGVPGVGKSTFIESLGQHLSELGEKVAVLAIDPSSILSKGSILGDKTRMINLVQKNNVYIRPSASRTTLGGVGQYTREAIILCEAAGYSTILIETVGVGQNEISVSEMVDFCMLLKLAGAGDELQGIKRGIIEMADSILINKADGNNINAAKLAKTEFENALHLYAKKSSGWLPKVKLCSAMEGIGISEAWQLVKDYISITKANGYFDKKRKNQNEYWMMNAIENRLKSSFFEQPQIQSEIKQQMKLLKANTISPFQAAETLLALYKSIL